MSRDLRAGLRKGLTVRLERCLPQLQRWEGCTFEKWRIHSTYLDFFLCLKGMLSLLKLKIDSTKLGCHGGIHNFWEIVAPVLFAALFPGPGRHIVQPFISYFLVLPWVFGSYARRGLHPGFFFPGIVNFPEKSAVFARKSDFLNKIKLKSKNSWHQDVQLMEVVPTSYKNVVVQ